MALRLINLHKQFDFIWSEDPDKDDPEKATVLQYRPLDAYEQAYLQDRIASIKNVATKPGATKEEMMANAETQTEVYRVAVDAVRLACTGFSNIIDDETDMPVEFVTENANISGRTKPVMAMDIVRRLPVNMCMEFWQNLMSVNSVSKSAEKNSAGASSPSNSSKTTTAKPARQTSGASEGTTGAQ